MATALGGGAGRACSASFAMTAYFGQLTERSLQYLLPDADFHAP